MSARDKQASRGKGRKECYRAHESRCGGEEPPGGAVVMRGRRHSRNDFSLSPPAQLLCVLPIGRIQLEARGPEGLGEVTHRDLCRAGKGRDGQLVAHPAPPPAPLHLLRPPAGQPLLSFPTWLPHVSLVLCTLSLDSPQDISCL